MQRPFSLLRLPKQNSFPGKIKTGVAGKHLAGNGVVCQYLAGIILTLVVLAGCSSSRRITPKILTFNYTVMPTRVNVADLLRDVTNGTRSISSLLGSNPCNFTADFSAFNSPSISVNGTPGQTGFNVLISAVHPSSITTTNPGPCVAISEINISIGGQSEALALHTQTENIQGNIVLANGSQFNIKQFFQGRVQSFDASTDRAAGDFRFITGLSGNPDSVLVVEGSYVLTP